MTGIHPAQICEHDMDLIDVYLATLAASPHNTKKLFALGFIGFPGTGKSTVADRLKSKLGIPVSSNDQIRRYLNKLGFEGSSPRQDLMRDFAELRTSWYYSHQTSVIIDANFTEQWQRSQKLAETYNAKLLLIQVTCERYEALRRIDVRLRSGDSLGSSLGDKEAYERAIRQSYNNPIPSKNIYFHINSQQPLDAQIDQLVGRLRLDDYV